MRYHAARSCCRAAEEDVIESNTFELTVRKAGEALRDGSLSAVALTESVLARIDETEPSLNAYIEVTSGLARRQAAVADEALQAGRDLGPLHGIPIALKDLYDVEGVPTTGGSAHLSANIPTQDAFVVERMREGGAVLVGKLGLHEFAMGTTNINPHFGPVRNPWGLDRVPGGSSGGSGASVAAGSCIASLGSDTGGSIRIPAALCGVAGLKPSTGRVSRRGVFPLSETLDHAGPLAKTVEDCALVLNVIAGHDPEDHMSQDVPVSDHTAELGRGLKGLRIGVPRDAQWTGASDEVRAACEEALAVLEREGAQLEEIELPLLASTERLLISRAESALVHREWLTEHPERFGADVRERLELGRNMTATEYVAELQLRRALTREVLDVLAGVDLLVSPTTPITAPTIEDGDRNKLLGRFTRGYNYTGIPAISVPCGFDSQGLPIGLMLGARPFEEATMCRAAHAYEQMTDWHRRRPPL